MKILMLISEAPPIRSGIARVADKLTTGLQDRGHQVDVLSLQDIPRKEWGEVRLSTMLLKLPELKERLPEYDLVHLHGPAPTFSDTFLLGGLRGLEKRPKLVYTHHAPVDLRHFPFRTATWLYNISQEVMARLADHVVVSTPSYRQRLARYVPPSKLSVIPWGVDFDKFAGPVEKPGPFTVLYLGQIRPYKGLPVLLDACAGLAGVRLWVIGKGHCEETCRRQAANLGLEDVTFWGSVSDAELVARLHESHVLVLPSLTRSEAFGIALLEGMSAGCVPVASHLPGVAGVVGNEGFTFPPGDVPALCEAIVRLRDDPALRTHLAGVAKAKARLYSWERVVFNYDRLFARLVAPPAAVEPGQRATAQRALSSSSRGA